MQRASLNKQKFKMAKCYRCGGETKFYDGAMGYEAMVCKKCGHHYSETSKSEFDLNKKAWELGL